MHAIISSLLAVIVLATPFARANSSFIYSHENHSLFEVVVKDDRNHTDQEPGLYYLDAESGDSKLLVRGEVVGANRVFKGILAYGPQSIARTSTHDAVAVVDGEITIFNRFSDPKKAGTTVVLGDKLRGIEILDAVQGLPVTLPKITSLTDVSYRTQSYLPPTQALPGGGHVFIMSVKAPSYLGDGLTFAFVLENGRQGKPRVVNNHAVLISHSFLPRESLDRLPVPIPNASAGSNQVVETRLLLYAPNVISKFKTQIARKSNSPVVKAWVEHLERFENFITNGYRNDKLNQHELALGVPLFEMFSQQEILPMSPVESITETPTTVIGQIFNHVSADFGIIQAQQDELRNVQVGKGVMRFIGTKKAEGKQIANLPIDRDPKTAKHRFIIQTADEIDPPGGHAYLLFSGGGAYLMARPINGGPKAAYQTIPIRNPVLNATDKIEFLRRPMTVNGQPGSALVIWRKRFNYSDARVKKEERTEISALALAETDGLSIASHQTLYDQAAPLTFEEARERLVEDNGAILFDKVTPVRGLKRYLAGEEEVDSRTGITTTLRFKTTPYEEISRATNKPARQRWLRTLLNHVIVQDLLTYKEFNETGAREQATGLYLNVTNPPEAKSPSESFLAGVPLHGYTGKPDDYPSYTLLSKSLYQPWGTRSSAPNVLMTLIPYDPTGELRALKRGEIKKKKGEDESVKFRAAFMFSPDRIGSPASGFRPWLRSLIVDRPYRSLQFTQVVQGTKSRANEVTVLFFFRADPNIPESRDEVLAASADLAWNGNSTGEPFSAQITTVELLHRGQVGVSAVHSHLRVDAEGSYYWVNDPAADRQSPQYRVAKLTQPTIAIPSRSGFNHLREPDEIRETDIGHVGGKRPVGGRWEMLTAHALADNVQGLKDQGDKRMQKTERKRRGDVRKDENGETRTLPSLGDGLAEQQLLAGFERALDQFATIGPGQLRRPRVFVVDKELKDKFKWTLYTKLALDNTAFSLQSPKFRFFQANKSLDDVEVSEELTYLRETGGEKARILFVDQEQFHANAQLQMRSYGSIDDEEPKDDFNPFPYDEPAARSNMLVLLSSGGKAKSLKGLKALPERPAPIPMLSIVTPDEWAEIKREQSAEVASGVLDDFTVDYNYLTTGWTMWPPRTNMADDDVKQLSKRPYRAEEMRVFPTLERVLNQAASGELAGKKTLILVPDELKSLVQTLVMVRWSTQDAAAGDWSYRNPKLSLNRVKQAHMKNQSMAIDNFRAMRGAASSRHSVLYSDLETITKIRRPDQDTHNRPIFRLRDPVQPGGEALFGEFDKKTTPPEALPAEVAVAEPEEAELPMLNDIELEDVSPEYIRGEIQSLNDSIQELGRALDEGKSRMVPPSSEFAQVLLADIQARKLRRESLLALQVRVEEAQAELHSEERDALSVNRDLAPHLLWWIASEGELVQPKPEPGWAVGKAIDPKIATILIGTPEELEKIEAEMTLESKYFNIREEFDVISLEAPSEETKFKLVQQLFEAPQVQSMQLNFELKRQNNRDPRSQLIYHFINRIDQLAYDQKIGQTTAFIRAYVALKSHLVEDSELYQSRVVSENFIERLFTKVFPMPLNREILEKRDPLNRLANQDQAVRDLQGAGVEGSQDLKRRIFETIFSQTRPTDTSRSIPNSQILFGPTSTGKTFFLRRLFKMFDFTPYVPAKTNNEEADYIFINVSKIVETENSSNPDSTTIAETIANIQDALAQPKGTRLSIVFDDFHDAKGKEVREKLYQFIRGLFEAPGGMYVTKSKSGKTVEIPVQNLNLYMTVNPTSIETQRRQYVKDGLKDMELLKREVLAAIAGDGFSADESFLARWADIIDMDKFPRSAKVPELVKRVRRNQIPNGQMVLVDPEVIFRLIDKYPEAHARELLGPATSALTAIPRDVEEGPIYLISNERATTLDRKSTQQGSVSQQDLAKAVRQFTRVETVKPGDPLALEHFMGFIMHNFRLQMFNSVALEASQGDLLRWNRPKVKNLLKSNFLLAMATHILDNPRLPLAELVVRPEEFKFYKKSQREELTRYHNALKDENYKSFFPVEFDVRERRANETLDAFISGRGTGFVEGRTRRDVLSETVTQLEKILAKALQLYVRIPSTPDLLSIGSWNEEMITTWFHQLPENEPEEEFERLRVEMIEVFQDFEQRLNGPDLEDSVEIELYSQVRLFAYAMDKAVTRLPWGQVANFMVNVAAQSNDSSLGSRTSYRNYVSDQQLSAFAIGTPEFMSDMFDTAINDNTNRRSEDDVIRLKQNFKKACDDLLSTVKGATR